MKKFNVLFAVISLVGLVSCGGDNTSSVTPSASSVTPSTSSVSTSETTSSVAASSSLPGSMDFAAWKAKITTALEKKAYADYVSFTAYGTETGGTFEITDMNMGFGCTWSDTKATIFMNDANMTIYNEYKSKETHTDEETKAYVSYITAKKEMDKAAVLTTAVADSFDYTSNKSYCYDESTKSYSFIFESGTTAWTKYYWNENLLLEKVDVKSGDLDKNLAFTWSKEKLADTTYSN